MAVPASKSRSTNPRPESIAAPKKQERHAWRIAILSTGAVILAGLIASGSSYLTARVQSNSQAQQARDDFLRSQRQAIYGKFLADHEHFFETDLKYCGGQAPILAQETPPAKGTAQSDELLGLLNSLAPDIYSLSLVATVDTYKRANELFADYSTMYTYCRSNLTFPSSITNSRDNSDKQINALNSAIGHRDALLKHFRDDIASG